MLQIEKAQVNKLLCAQSPDAALLYLYLLSGGDSREASKKLGYTGDTPSAGLVAGGEAAATSR